MKAGPNVAFDFDAALALARQLYALADHMAGVGATRQSGAEGAGVGFEGSYARAFATRMANEAASVSAAAGGLRADAHQLARDWKEEMDNQNRVRYGRHVDALKAQRSEIEKVTEFFVGGFHYPPEPEGVPIPQPPAFAPTASLVVYPAPAAVHTVPLPMR